MKKITITIGSTKEVMTPGGVAGWPSIDLSVEGEMHRDELAGILLIEYVKAAKKFVEQHPKECNNCPAYRLNYALIYRVDHLKKEIFEGKY